MTSNITLHYGEGRRWSPLSPSKPSIWRLRRRFQTFSYQKSTPARASVISGTRRAFSISFTAFWLSQSLAPRIIFLTNTYQLSPHRSGYPHHELKHSPSSSPFCPKPAHSDTLYCAVLKGSEDSPFMTLPDHSFSFLPKKLETDHSHLLLIFWDPQEA